MTVGLGDMSDLLNGHAGRSARQVLGGHARNRDTITIVPVPTRGDSAPYRLLFCPGYGIPHAVPWTLQRTLYFLAVYDATSG